MLPVLATPRLTLRPASGADTDAVWRLLVLPEVRRFLCDDEVLPREVVADILARCAGEAAQGMGMWVAEQDGALAGVAALRPVGAALAALVPSLAGEVEPTVALAPERWGQGLAGEALGAVLRHGFATLDLARIAAVCDAPNVASARMLARAGFRETGEHPGPRYRVRTWTKMRG